jgi:hypothetical protein
MGMQYDVSSASNTASAMVDVLLTELDRPSAEHKED